MPEENRKNEEEEEEEMEGRHADEERREWCRVRVGGSGEGKNAKRVLMDLIPLKSSIFNNNELEISQSRD